MKIGKITSNDPLVRRQFGFHKSFYNRLERYQARYLEMFGEEVHANHLIEQMCQQFMDSDKEFVRWEKDREKAAKPVKKPEPASKPSSGDAESASASSPAFAGLSNGRVE